MKLDPGPSRARRDAVRRTAPRGGCWPSREQELLLQAVLLPAGEARRAWEAWRAAVPDLAALDAGSTRLLPLLHLRMGEMRLTHPQADLIRQVRRQAWHLNLLLEQDLARALRALRSAGLRTMVLKGAALVRTAYPDLAARPMGDVDVLVSVADAEEAIAALRGLGLEPTHPVTPRRIQRVHSVGFTGPAGRVVDLHWHLVEEDCRPDADNDLWERAVPVEVGGVATLALDPTDQLYQMCVHGVRWEESPPVRWVADAVLLAGNAAIAWDRLVDVGARHRVALPLRLALEYLRSRLSVAVPPRVLDGLAALDVARWERRELELKAKPRTDLRRLLFHWYNHRRQCGNGGLLHRLAGFPGYLLDRWGLASPLAVPAFLVRALRRKI